MGHPSQRPVEIFRIHPATLCVTVFSALLLQTFLPLRVPLARLFDFPLLVTIYFALVRRDKVFATGLGTVLGLLQDALAHGFIGMFGTAKALVGYLAASASVKFELGHLVARSVLTAILVLVQAFILLGLQHGLLEFPPPFQALDLASSLLVNVALGLVLFQALDRLKQPA